MGKPRRTQHASLAAVGLAFFGGSLLAGLLAHLVMNYRPGSPPGSLLAGLRAHLVMNYRPGSPPDDLECTVVFGIDVATLAELFELTRPCKITGLATAQHVETARLWSPKEMRASGLSKAALNVRLTRGENYSRVMRYSTRMGAKSFVDPYLGLTWPRHRLDAWDFSDGWSLEQAILHPPHGTSASFSANVDGFDSVHPAGVRAAQALETALCKLWHPQGCAEQLERQTLLWMASAGLGQQLHYDKYANVFFHLFGHKEMVLVPPTAMVDTAYLFPEMHPASRQSQLGWSAEDATRRPRGFSTVEGQDGERPPPAYDATVEQRVRLRPGEVLFLPPLWGHQTFTSIDGPSISCAIWFFPSVAAAAVRGARPTAGELRGRVRDEKLQAAANRALASVRTAPQAWGALRTLGVHALQLLLGAEAGALLRSRWMAQRWRPQLGGLNVSAHAPIAAVVVCEAAPDADVVAEAAQQLVAHIHELARWYPAAHDVALRDEAQSLLDWLVSRLPQLRLDDDLRRHGVDVRSSMLVPLVRSLAGECDDGTTHSLG